MNLEESFLKLKENRYNFSTTSVYERKAKLYRLKDAINLYRQDIYDALHLDFRKAANETELTEVFPTLHEISFACKNLKKWMKPKRVKTPIILFGAGSKILPEARGIVLVMAPWNYPFYLIMSPLISAISAGNVVMLRPSEKTPHTSLIIKKIIDYTFSESEVAVALGDIEVSKKILDLPFDHIFYTGSTTVGKIVMEKAAKHLSTVTLELGGKSPVIVDNEVDLEDAALKIVWGKFINAGQTCVAPDYVFVPENLKENFLKRLKEKIEVLYGDTISGRKANPDFARLIDEKAFHRMLEMLKDEKILLPDLVSYDDRLYIPPSIITDAKKDSRSMQEEIFGPVLPILTYKNLEEVIEHIRSHDKPLALYIFSKNKKNIKRIIQSTSAGGTVVNNVIMHLANPYLPFGGVGASGMGTSHGVHGFLEFSHQRALLYQSPFSMGRFYYPPYNSFISKLAFKILNYLE